MRCLIFLATIFSSLVASAQSHLLLLDDKDYLERNIVRHDTVLVLKQEITDKNPKAHLSPWGQVGLHNGKVGYMLDVVIKDTNVAKSRKILDLVTDSSVIKVYLLMYDNVLQYRPQQMVSGKIGFIKWTDSEIEIMEDFTIGDEKQKDKKWIYKGTRTFVDERKK